MKLFRFVKKVFFLRLTILSNFTNALDCISMKNQECKIRPEIININSNNPIFYPFSIKINKWSLLNRVLSVLSCSRAWRAYVLACSRAWRAYMLACSRAWRAYVLGVLVCTCFAYVLPMMRAWRVYH